MPRAASSAARASEDAGETSNDSSREQVFFHQPLHGLDIVYRQVGIEFADLALQLGAELLRVPRGIYIKVMLEKPGRCAYGIYTYGFVVALRTWSCFTSFTTPTISMSGSLLFLPPPNLKCMPMGFRPGKKRLTIDSLATADFRTGGAIGLAEFAAGNQGNAKGGEVVGADC